MTLVLIFGIILEFVLIKFSYLWSLRRIGSVLVVATIGAWAGYNAFAERNLIWTLLMIVMVFRIINILKLVKTNLHQDYQQRVTSRTSLSLGLITALLFILGSFKYSLSYESIWSTLGLLQVIFGASILAITARNLQKTQHHTTKHFYTDKELPTVTVAIPARNETDDLASCLRTVLANDYPKLEIIVLDDCSQDRTPEIIKDFAHDGVRFISGEPPHERWLAKNQAYERLASEASGEVVLFCGVDVRFGPQAIRSLVSSMLSKKRTMMSVLPFRVGGGVQTSLVQPLRYWWELALPRRKFNRPPVLSTCWLIERKSLNKLGRFKGVSHNILPERFFARELIKNDVYAFIRADEHLDVRTVKPVEEQLKTAIRVKYPSLRKRPENVLILILVQITVLFMPIVLALSWLWSGATVASILGLVASILLIITHYLIMSASHPLHSTIALFNYPFAILTDISLLIISMFRYEFGNVVWKGRNVCIPAMHVIKKLPELK